MEEEEDDLYGTEPAAAAPAEDLEEGEEEEDDDDDDESVCFLQHTIAVARLTSSLGYRNRHRTSRPWPRADNVCLAADVLIRLH